MKSIWKFQIEPPRHAGEWIIVEAPVGANWLCAHEQNDEICVWAEVETTNPMEPNRFLIYGTGFDIECEYTRKYLGSAFLEKGHLVFHVYVV